MIDIQDYLDDILEKSYGEEVIVAIMGALSTIVSDPKVASQEIDISEELNIIEHNPNGNIVRKAISRALEKISRYDKQNDKIVLIDSDLFSSLEEYEQDCLYLIHNDGESSILAVDENGKIIVEEPFNVSPILSSSYQTLRNILSTTSYKKNKYRITLGKYSIFDAIYPYQFRGVTNLTHAYLLTDGLTIGKQAFKNCYNLKYVEIGSGAVSISGSAFDGCVGLRKIVIRQEEGSIQGQPWGAPSNPEIIWRP